MRTVSWYIICCVAGPIVVQRAYVRGVHRSFDVEIGAKSKNQKCKDLLSPDDDEQFEHRQKGYGGNKNIQNGLLFVRLYRPFDITICQFADGRSANHERKKAAECEFEPYAMEPGDDIRILQHPLGKPTIQSCGKVLAARDVSDLTKHPKKRSGLPAPGNMEYDASTLPGSSGSPIFDASDDWKLLGACLGMDIHAAANHRSTPLSTFTDSSLFRMGMSLQDTTAAARLILLPCRGNVRKMNGLSIECGGRQASTTATSARV